MNEIILNYIVQGILGGASGYITNDYAINMLFKEYTPLKIGGVIKKTRSEFIENLSSMVENDIINKEKLEEILKDEEFKIEFEKLSKDFYNYSLYEKVDLKTFSDIDSFESTINSTNIFAKELINNHMPELYKLMTDNINIDELANSNVLNKMCEILYHNLKDTINNNDIIQNFVLSVLNNNEKLILNDFIDDNIKKKVIHRSVDICTKLLTELDNNELGETLSNFEIEKALNFSLEILSNKKVEDILILDNEVLQIINSEFSSYINSPHGINNINTIMDSLFSYGKECDISVLQVLDSNFEKNLQQYIIDIIPSLRDSIINAVNENGNLINYLIVECIDDVIKECDGIKAKLLSIIKNTYLSGLNKKYNIVDKIIEYIEKITQPEKLSQELSSKIINILENLKVRDVIVELENMQINPEHTGKLLIDYLNENSDSLIKKAIMHISKFELKPLFSKIIINKNFNGFLANKLKYIPNSSKGKSYLINLSQEYVDNLFSKEIKELITEEQSTTFSLHVKNYAVDKIKISKEEIVKTLETGVVTFFNDYKKKVQQPELTSILNNEVYKLYNRYTEDLTDTNLSTAIHRLNTIENLAENSSNYVYSYLETNTDTMLNGLIKATVTDNLNKLNDNELVNLANDFIGRELKPIMFFGGVLGIIAGLLLAAFQNSPIDPGAVSISNMVVYAFVGFITNVIAINMLFKPYKENKLLSKIPFFRNFSIGYIVNNQEKFAEKTATFIDNDLLSKKSINKLFEKHRDNIKYSITNGIAKNKYSLLSKLIDNNKHKIVSNMYIFIKRSFLKNTNNMSLMLNRKIKNIELSSLMNETITNKGSSFLISKIQPAKISENLYNLIHSNMPLSTVVSSDMLSKQANNKLENNYYHVARKKLSHKNELISYLLNYEDTYKVLTSKTINEIINAEKKESFLKYTEEKVVEAVIAQTAIEKVSQILINASDNFMATDKALDEIFNGKLKIYVDSKIPSMLHYLTESIKSNIIKNNSSIVEMVQLEIKNSLGFIEKSMYSLMGGDEIIEELITKIITTKSPKFIDDKKEELNSIVFKLLNDKLYKTKINLIYTGLNKNKVTEILSSYVNKKSNLETIASTISSATEEVYSKVEDLKLNNVLKLVNGDELTKLVSTYDLEINAFIKEISINLDNNKEEILQKLSTLNDLLINKFMETDLKEIFEDISINDLNNVVQEIFKELKNNDLEKLIHSSLVSSKKHINIKLGAIAQGEDLEKILENYFKSLFQNPEFEIAIKEHIDKIIEKAVTVNFNFINNDTKKHVVDIFVESCINSLENNLDDILKSIEFNKIAREEIEKMEPKKIHEMFNSFGEKYFKRLMLYGFGGFVFGINVYIGMTLTGLKIISESKKSQNKYKK